MMSSIYFIIVIVLALACGMRLAGVMRLNFFSKIEKAAFSFTLGLAAISYFTFAFGTAGFLYRGLIYLAMLVASIIFLPQIISIMRAIISALSGIGLRKIKIGREGAIFILIILAFACLTFIEALAPVYMWDSLAYQMSALKIYIREHRVFSIAYMPASSWPAAVNMIYLFGLLLKNDTVAQLLSWSISAAMVLALYSLARRYFGARVARLSALAFCSVPIFIYYVPITYVDLGTALFSVMALYSFLNWFNTRGKSWLIICAINSGMAMWSKLSGAFVMPLVALGIICAGFNSKHEGGRIFKDVFIFLAISLVLGLPWYIKVWFETGNPFFPFFYNIFGGRNWNALSDASYTRILGVFRLKGIGDLLLLPFNWTFGSFDVSTGVLFLAFLPLVIYRLVKAGADRNIKLITALSFLSAASALMITTQPRFVFAAFWLYSIAVGFEIDRVWASPRFFGFILMAFLCFLVFSWNLNAKKQEVSVALGKTGVQEYLQQRIPFYRQFRWMNENLPSSSRILTSSIHCYYLERDYIWMPPVQGLIDYSRIKDARTLLQRLKELKVTHIFYMPKERISRAMVGEELDGLYTSMFSLGKMTLVKKWHLQEMLGGEKQTDTFLYSLTY